MTGNLTDSTGSPVGTRGALAIATNNDTSPRNSAADDVASTSESCNDVMQQHEAVADIEPPLTGCGVFLETFDMLCLPFSHVLKTDASTTKNLPMSENYRPSQQQENRSHLPIRPPLLLKGSWTVEETTSAESPTPSYQKRGRFLVWPAASSTCNSVVQSTQ